MSPRLQDNLEAASALVGRTIVSIDLGQIEEENGDLCSGIPTIVLDNGVIITFDVDDYGSGTYGVNVRQDNAAKARKAKSTEIKSTAQATRVVVERDGTPGHAVITVSERQPNGRYKAVESICIPHDTIDAVCAALKGTR